MKTYDIYKNFLLLNHEALKQSEFLVSYKDRFGIEHDGEIEYEYLISALNSLCVQLLSFIDLTKLNIPETIVIFSYSTGHGLIEAYFCYWLKINNHCKYTNFVYYETIDYYDTYVRYNIFDKIFPFKNFDKNCKRLQMIHYNLENNKQINEFTLDYYNYEIDLFITINPQGLRCSIDRCFFEKNESGSYNCSDFLCHHKKILNFFAIIGFLKIIKREKEITLTELTYHKIFEWMNDVGMCFIFIGTSLFINNNKIVNMKESLNDENSEYYKTQKNKFGYLLNPEIIMSTLFNIFTIFNLKVLLKKVITYKTIYYSTIQIGGYKKKSNDEKTDYHGYIKYKKKYLNLKNKK